MSSRSEDFPCNNDILRSMLINEGVSGSLHPYYELVQDNDLSATGGLLLRRKRLWELQVRKRILSQRPGEMRLGQFSPGDIFTTGLPRGDADRCISS